MEVEEKWFTLYKQIIDDKTSVNYHVYAFCKGKSSSDIEKEILNLSRFAAFDQEAKKITIDELLNRLEVANQKEKKSKSIRWEFARTIFAVCIGAILSYILQKQPKDIVLNPVVLPKFQIVHDTIFVQSSHTKDQVPK